MSEGEVQLHGAIADEDVLSCIICKNMLRDPVLLLCLHNACRLCAEEAAAKLGTNCVQCSSCCVTTDITIKKDNLLVAAQVQCLTALKNADTCGFCRQDGKPDESSSAWCIQCQESLCDRCLSEHRKHNRSHRCVTVNETTNWSELRSFPPRPCSEHGKVLELVCLTCERPVCLECAISSCNKEAHEVKLLSDPETKIRLSKITEHIDHLVATFESVSGVLLRHISFPDRILADRDIDLDKLRTAKKCAIDAVSTAYQKAEDALKECYDSLQVKASEVRCAAELLKQAVQSGVRYNRLAMNSGDVIGLFSQQKTLESRLGALLAELSRVNEPLESARLVHVNIRLPLDLDQIIGAWMGLPKLLTDDVCCALDSPMVHVDAGDYNTEKAKLGPLHFGAASGSFQLPISCLDVAVALNGHLLVAAQTNGLKEYDLSGKELSSWKPPMQSTGKDDWVTAVDVLDDGTAAVGVLYSQLIVLLRSSAGKWLEDRRVVLRQSPRHLSVHGNIIAVAAYRSSDDGKNLVSGPQLQLMRLSSGEQLYRQSREYDIQSVAVTPVAVITASLGKVRLSNGSEQFVVDGYSLLGDRLWRHESSDDVQGVCAAPTGRTLYLALSESRKVKAIGAEDGRQLNDVIGSDLASSQSGPVPPRPGKLSLARGQQPALAVLCGDVNGSRWDTVTVYPAVTS